MSKRKKEKSPKPKDPNKKTTKVATECPHFMSDWDNHAKCRKCRTCSEEDPCDVCRHWPEQLWAGVRKNAKNKEAMRQRRKEQQENEKAGIPRKERPVRTKEKPAKISASRKTSPKKRRKKKTDDIEEEIDLLQSLDYDA